MSRRRDRRRRQRRRMRRQMYGGDVTVFGIYGLLMCLGLLSFIFSLALRAED